MSLLSNRRLPEAPLKHAPVVWVIRPRSNEELFSLALELGNLHAPVEFDEGQILVAPDGPVEEVLERMQLTWEIRRST
jgi:urease accessory protein UreE